MYFIRLSLLDQVRLVFTPVNIGDYIGILAPHIRAKVPPGEDFTLLAGNSSYTYKYIVKDGDEFISTGNKYIPMSKGRSLTGVIMDKLTDNEFTRKYHEYRDSITKTMKDFSEL